jgi:5-methylcytosine-specific restriction protein A
MLYPLCSECLREGRTTATDEIDHIIPLKDGGPDTDENCTGLCKKHHDTKTAQDMGWNEKTTYGEDGWPVG